ncbi:unnamed protein product [Protopolystoma xenopodis]|uniref:Uncharacterized protein n=1 Tax=Protopolystoma xenopodis TaxID=117903 RepID=A0A3S5FCD9_9PLAT|nr:unnamed protein product [Protopolystoma xenopodis]
MQCLVAKRRTHAGGGRKRSLVGGNNYFPFRYRRTGRFSARGSDAKSGGWESSSAPPSPPPPPPLSPSSHPEEAGQPRALGPELAAVQLAKTHSGPRSAACERVWTWCESGPEHGPTRAKLWPGLRGVGRIECGFYTPSSAVNPKLCGRVDGCKVDRVLTRGR